MKYNNEKGVIVVLVSLNHDLVTNETMIETEVIDTGLGIAEDRQNTLFKPFLELKKKQNFEKVKDKTIGMGLACSKDISLKLGGDVDLNFSKPGLTSFSFRIPVKMMNSSFKQEKLEFLNLDQHFTVETFTEQPLLKEYLECKDLDQLNKFKFECCNDKQVLKITDFQINKVNSFKFRRHSWDPHAIIPRQILSLARENNGQISDILSNEVV